MDEVLQEMSELCDVEGEGELLKLFDEKYSDMVDRLDQATE
jgi:hypothetical protein